jgi:two-component system OmpR family response regulator
MLATALRLSGYEISEATSGTEAIEKAACARHGLIILDLGLPDMSGIDAAQAIKKTRSQPISLSLRSPPIPTSMG